MDELTRLRAFHPAVPPSTAARSAAENALRAAINVRRRRSPVRPAVVVAFLLAAVIVTAAYAVVREVIVGSVAPPSLVQVERRLSGPIHGLLIRSRWASLNPGIEVDRTFAAAVVSSPVGPAYLWVAPDTDGSYCAFLQVVAIDLPGGRPNLTGGCDVTGRVSVSVLGTAPGQEKRGVYRPFVYWLQAYASVAGAKTLQVHFTEGAVRSYPLINHWALGFVGPGGLAHGVVGPALRVSSAVVLDAHGHALASYRAPVPPHRHPGAPGPALASGMRVVATLPEYGTHRLMVEQGDPGRTCKQVTVPFEFPRLLRDGRPNPAAGRVYMGHTSGCGLPPSPDAIMVNPAQFASGPTGVLFLSGSVGTDVHSLELFFRDGSHVDIAIHKGYVLYQIDPKNYAAGREPTEVVARDAAGRVVQVRKLPFA